VPSVTALRAAELLEELGMTKRADALPAELSGGERQRVAICRALVNDPDLLLVDEPTASLDSVRGQQVVELLADEVRRRGKAGIMVTHDLAMTRLADRRYEMHDGVLRGAEATSDAQRPRSSPSF
jgi:putative ABC transport system ATP-binding protein